MSGASSAPGERPSVERQEKVIREIPDKAVATWERPAMQRLRQAYLKQWGEAHQTEKRYKPSEDDVSEDDIIESLNAHNERLIDERVLDIISTILGSINGIAALTEELSKKNEIENRSNAIAENDALKDRRKAKILALTKYMMGMYYITNALQPKKNKFGENPTKSDLILREIDIPTLIKAGMEILLTGKTLESQEGENLAKVIIPNLEKVNLETLLKNAALVLKKNVSELYPFKNVSNLSLREIKLLLSGEENLKKEANLLYSPTEEDLLLELEDLQKKLTEEEARGTSPQGTQVLKREIQKIKDDIIANELKETFRRKMRSPDKNTIIDSRHQLSEEQKLLLRSRLIKESRNKDLSYQAIPPEDAALLQARHRFAQQIEEKPSPVNASVDDLRNPPKKSVPPILLSEEDEKAEEEAYKNRKRYPLEILRTLQEEQARDEEKLGGLVKRMPSQQRQPETMSAITEKTPSDIHTPSPIPPALPHEPQISEEDSKTFVPNSTNGTRNKNVTTPQTEPSPGPSARKYYDFATNPASEKYAQGNSPAKSQTPTRIPHRNLFLIPKNPESQKGHVPDATDNEVTRVTGGGKQNKNKASRPAPAVPRDRRPTPSSERKGPATAEKAQQVPQKPETFLEKARRIANDKGFLATAGLLMGSILLGKGFEDQYNKKERVEKIAEEHRFIESLGEGIDEISDERKFIKPLLEQPAQTTQEISSEIKNSLPPIAKRLTQNTETYTVRSGNSLWSIAKSMLQEATGNKETPPITPALVAAIKSANPEIFRNNPSSIIQPGDILNVSQAKEIAEKYASIYREDPIINPAYFGNESLAPGYTYASQQEQLAKQQASEKESTTSPLGFYPETNEVHLALLSSALQKGETPSLRAHRILEEAGLSGRQHTRAKDVLLAAVMLADSNKNASDALKLKHPGEKGYNAEKDNLAMERIPEAVKTILEGQNPRRIAQSFGPKVLKIYDALMEN